MSLCGSERTWASSSFFPVELQFDSKISFQDTFLKTTITSAGLSLCICLPLWCVVFAHLWLWKFSFCQAERNEKEIKKKKVLGNLFFWVTLLIYPSFHIFEKGNCPSLHVNSRTLCLFYVGWVLFLSITPFETNLY